MKKTTAIEILSPLEFCVFDLETTGGNQQTDKIIEIGMVRIQNLKIISEKNFLIQPEIKIPEFIQNLTNIYPKDVKNAPLIEEVIDEILDFMGERILVAHNTSFDIPFFNSVLKRLGKNSLQNKNLCTNLMTKYLVPSLLNSNLNYMSRIFNIGHTKAHRALDDARATAELLIKYLDVFMDKGLSKINHLYYPRNKFELDRFYLKKGEDLKNLKHLLVPIQSPLLVTIKGENGTILTVFPFDKNKNFSLIEESLALLDWKTLTLKMIGHPFELFIQMAPLLPRIKSSERFKIINDLWEAYLPEETPSSQNNTNQEETEEETPKKFCFETYGDFVILNHLVPEQYIIYSTQSLGHSERLVFRYPGHQKKLLQYTKSRTARILSSKLKKVHYPEPFNEFLFRYIQYHKKGLLFMSDPSLKKKKNLFLESLDHFIEENPNSYNFPTIHI